MLEGLLEVTPIQLSTMVDFSGDNPASTLMCQQQQQDDWPLPGLQTDGKNGDYLKKLYLPKVCLYGQSV